MSIICCAANITAPNDRGTLLYREAGISQDVCGLVLTGHANIPTAAAIVNPPFIPRD
jgi:hypothetical protein